jgi:hypothetical protein
MSDAWKADKVKAALDESKAIAEDVQASTGWDVAPAKIDNRIGLFCEEVRQSFFRGEIEFCEHSTSPRPMLLAIAEPTHAYCESCGPALIQLTMADASRANLCDLCGAESREFAEVTIQNGPFLMLGNVCPGCRVGSFE